MEAFLSDLEQLVNENSRLCVTSDRIPNSGSDQFKCPESTGSGACTKQLYCCCTIQLHKSIIAEFSQQVSVFKLNHCLNVYVESRLAYQYFSFNFPVYLSKTFIVQTTGECYP